MSMVRIIYFRCPVCGKVSRPKNFTAKPYLGHPLEALLHDFGGRGKSVWHHQVAIDDYVPFKKQLVSILRAIADRLERELWVESRTVKTLEPKTELLKVYQADSALEPMGRYAGVTIASLSSQRVKIYGSSSMAQSVAVLP